MEWLNYHHLLYFWVVARKGSIVRASQELNLAQSTISGQLRVLEEEVGDKLFMRIGRNLALTDTGRMVYRYADEIFTLGRELREALQGRVTDRPMRVTIGITDVLPKLVAYRLLEPALHIEGAVQLTCQEGKLEQLLAELAVYNLDVVLSDAPVGPLVKVRAFNRLLGECGVSFFGVPTLAAAYRPHFPQSLQQAPLLAPTDNTVLRRNLDQWFDAQGLYPTIVGEFEDSALLKVFGQQGIGLFTAPSVIEAEVKRQYNVEVIGRVEAVKERFYAITVDRKLRHPAVIAMSDAAQQNLFD
jgi:LysR family transcriptional regulator, transcriptional activator of nhaA